MNTLYISLANKENPIQYKRLIEYLLMNSLVQMVQMQWSTAAIPPWKEWANMCLAQLDHLNNQEDIFCDQNWQINFHFSHAFSHQPDPSATLPKTGWCDRTLVSYVRRSQAFIISKTLQKLIHGLKKNCYKCISRIKKNTPFRAEHASH